MNTDYTEKQMKATAIIPAKNRINYLLRAINSVISQKGVICDIIVIDDGSEPPISIDELNAISPNIKLVRNNTSLNAAASRNIGATLANTDYILFLDSDDEWKDDHAYGAISELNSHTDTDAYFAPCAAQPEIFKSEKIHRVLIRGLDIRTSGFAFRRAAFLEFGGFDPLQEKHQDWDLAVRYSHKRKVIYGSKQTFLIRSDANGRMSNKSNLSASYRFLEKNKAILSDDEFIFFAVRFLSSALGDQNINNDYYRLILRMIRDRRIITFKSSLLTYAPFAYKAMKDMRRWMAK